MNVKVTIDVSTLPIEKNIDDLRRAAFSLTDNRKSIMVKIIDNGGLFSLITNFTMRTTAQYKVVDNISREFKFWTFDLDGYEEMTISFPKSVKGD